MILLIPIGGTGERFAAENYSNPKPLINVLGKPMINWVLDSFKLHPTDKVVIVHREELNHFNFQAYIKNCYPDWNIQFVELKFNTRGAAETVLCGLNNVIDLDQPIMISDCDTFYEENVVSDYKEEGGNCIFYFNDTDDKPIFSYITFDAGQVSSIKEKVKISDNANTGLYCFESGSLLKNYCVDLLTSLPADSKELYISEIYKRMLVKKETITAIKVEKFHCLGTPFQLQLFATNNIQKGSRKRFCFDFDNTLVSFPKVKNDYSTVEPIDGMIKYVRFLKAAGHHIIIHTARRMKTHKGNVGAVLADIGMVTLETIKKFNIPCDELFLGKPYADFYIDDKAINPFLEPQKEMGFYNGDIAARSFNNVVINKDHVTKTSESESFQGEMHWYQNIPQTARHLFPKAAWRDNVNSLTLEKINGISLSYLYVNNSLTENTLITFLDTLKFLHESAKPGEKLPIYSNYCNKMSDRMLLPELRPRWYNDTFQKIYDYLNIYEKEDRGMVSVIHGDPVFTNVLLEKNNNFKFIDMRGRLGNRNTIFGDMFYDYAKVYQSLIGYDFILHNQTFNKGYMLKLQEAFERFIAQNYGLKAFIDITMITNSLLLTLMPLHYHEDPVKCNKYYDLISFDPVKSYRWDI